VLRRIAQRQQQSADVRMRLPSRVLALRPATLGLARHAGTRLTVINILDKRRRPNRGHPGDR
jgi:hypothetical protein